MADRTKPAGTAIGDRYDGDGGAPDGRVARLRAALRRERARGRAGHWTYDLSRHLALAKQLKDAEGATRAAPPRP